MDDIIFEKHIKQNLERSAGFYLHIINMKKNKGYLLVSILLMSTLVACKSQTSNTTTENNTETIEASKPVKSDYNDIKVDNYITLDNYTHYAIDKKALEVSDDEVESEINKLLRIETTNFEQIKDRAIKDGDGVNTTYKVTCGDEVIIDIKDSNITIGDQNIFFGIDEKLIGLKCGDKKTFNTVYPDDYFDANYANKPVKIEVEINYILGDYNESALTEQIASNYSNGECKDAKSFKEYIKNNLIEDNKRNYFSQILSNIIDGTTINKDISKLVKEEIEIEKNNIEIYKTTMELTQEDLYKSYQVSSEEELQEAIKSSAEYSVKAKLVVEKLAEDLDIVVTEQEQNDYIKSAQESYGKYADIYTNAYVVENIQRDKIIDKLAEIYE